MGKGGGWLRRWCGALVRVFVLHSGVTGAENPPRNGRRAGASRDDPAGMCCLSIAEGRGKKTYMNLFI